MALEVRVISLRVGRWGWTSAGGHPGHLNTRLGIDGPPGVPFSANYLQVYVSHDAARGGSGNDDGSFEGETPYERDLVAPASQLLYPHRSTVRPLARRTTGTGARSCHSSRTMQ